MNYYTLTISTMTKAVVLGGFSGNIYEFSYSFTHITHIAKCYGYSRVYKPLQIIKHLLLNNATPAPRRATASGGSTLQLFPVGSYTSTVFVQFQASQPPTATIRSSNSAHTATCERPTFRSAIGRQLSVSAL